MRKLAQADIGVSTTGIAGPDGGTDEKPVGLVYVGVDSENYSTVLECRLSRGYRDERAAARATCWGPSRADSSPTSVSRPIRRS